MNHEVIDMEGAPEEPQQATTAIAQQTGPSQGAIAASATPADLLRLAVEQGADIDKLAKLMDLQERWEANQARKAFVAAMAAFKRNPPDIYKDKDVSHGQGKTAYSHATLGNICEKIIAGLADHGVSHNWSTIQADGKVKVTCTLTHELGHSENTVLEAAPDTSGSKNPIQAIGSTVTYLSRYTLLAACGIAVKDGSDDDGAGAGMAADMRQDAAQRRGQPQQQVIGKKGLQAAIDSILAGKFTREALERDYKLEPEQVEHVDSILGKKAGA